MLKKATHVIAAVTCLACAGSPKLLGAPVRKPIALTFNATPDAAAHLDRAALAITIAHLKEGLKDRGIESYTPGLGEPAPPPRIDLSVTHWVGKVDVGREAGPNNFWVAPLIAHAVHDRDVEIECFVLREGDAKPSFHHAFSGYSGKDVADQILSRIFSDRTGDNGVDPIMPERHY
jgi:hypothetical protein